MQPDQETLEEFSQCFTALAGPDEYSITFPASMSKNLSPEECEAILDRTIAFAEGLLEEKISSSRCQSKESSSNPVFGHVFEGQNHDEIRFAT